MNTFVCLLSIFAIQNLPIINGFPCWNSFQWPTQGYVPSSIGLSNLKNLQLSPTVASNLQIIPALPSSSPLPINAAWPWANGNIINPWLKSILQNTAVLPASESCQNSGNYIIPQTQNSSPYQIVEIARPQVFVQKQPSVKILPSNCS